MKIFIKGQEESNKGHKQVFCQVKELQRLDKTEEKHAFGEDLPQEREETCGSFCIVSPVKYQENMISLKAKD